MRQPRGFPLLTRRIVFRAHLFVQLFPVPLLPKHLAIARYFGYTRPMNSRTIPQTGASGHPLNNASKKTSGATALNDLANWNAAICKSFDDLLASYKVTPTSKSVLNSMIKFEGMYRDVNPGLFSTNFWTDFGGINEERRGKRLRTYLAKRDLIKTVSEGGEKEIVVTTRAHKIFYESYPLAQLRKQKWDGTWTVVTYDVPEPKKTEREYLRGRLKDLGFGCPQDSLYVCPLHLEEPLRELIEGEELTDYVWVISATRVLGLDNKDVAAKAWNLNHFNELYTALLEALPKVKRARNKKLISEWREYFLALDSADPYLPRELLPDGWLGEKCKKEFFKMSRHNLLSLLLGLS